MRRCCQILKGSKALNENEKWNRNYWGIYSVAFANGRGHTSHKWYTDVGWQRMLKRMTQELERPCNDLILCQNNLGYLIKNNLKKGDVRVNRVVIEIIDKEVSSISNKRKQLRAIPCTSALWRRNDRSHAEQQQHWQELWATQKSKRERAKHSWTILSSNNRKSDQLFLREKERIFSPHNVPGDKDCWSSATPLAIQFSPAFCLMILGRLPSCSCWWLIITHWLF